MFSDIYAVNWQTGPAGPLAEASSADVQGLNLCSSPPPPPRACARARPRAIELRKPPRFLERTARWRVRVGGLTATWRTHQGMGDVGSRMAEELGQSGLPSGLAAPPGNRARFLESLGSRGCRRAPRPRSWALGAGRCSAWCSLGSQPVVDRPWVLLNER